jgi:hypothetical protein
VNAIQWVDSFASDKRRRGIAVAVLAALPALLVLIACRLGPGLSPDSVMYASAARSFAGGGSLIAYDGHPLTIFPPGLPVILGSVQRLGIDLQAATVALNIACVALCTLLTYLLAMEALGSWSCSAAITVFFSLSASTIEIFTMLWTEPLFTILSLVTLLVLVRSVRRQSLSRVDIALVAIAVSLATTLRFFGFTLLPVVALGALLAARPRGRGRALAAATIAVALSTTGLMIVAGRNLSLGVSPLGERFPATVSPFTAVRPTVQALGGYVLPLHSVPISEPLGVALSLLLVYGLVRALLLRAETIVLLGAFVAVYWVLLWFSEIATNIGPADARLTIPIFTPMMILVAFACRDIASRHAKGEITGGPVRLWPASVATLMVLVFVSLALNAYQSLKTVWVAATSGIGYNGTTLLSSPLALALQGLPSGGIAATDSALAYWTSGRSPVIAIPERNYYWPAQAIAQGAQDLVTRVENGEVVYLAYFSVAVDHAATTALSPQELAGAGLELRRRKSFADGDLYEVHPGRE